jgi:hypothetical protein
MTKQRAPAILRKEALKAVGSGSNPITPVGHRQLAFFKIVRASTGGFNLVGDRMNQCCLGDFARIIRLFATQSRNDERKPWTV